MPGFIGLPELLLLGLVVLLVSARSGCPRWAAGSATACASSRTRSPATVKHAARARTVADRLGGRDAARPRRRTSPDGAAAPPRSARRGGRARRSSRASSARASSSRVGLTVGYVRRRTSFHARLIELLERRSGRRPQARHVRRRRAVPDVAAGLPRRRFAIALPIVLWQLWASSRRRSTRTSSAAIGGFVVFAAALFAVGLAFGYTVALPAALIPDDLRPALYDIQIRAADYISFSLIVLVAVGVVFELPVFVLALVRLGALSLGDAAPEPAHRLPAVAALAVALPGVTRSRRPSRWCRCSCSSSLDLAVGARRPAPRRQIRRSSRRMTTHPTITSTAAASAPTTRSARPHRPLLPP